MTIDTYIKPIIEKLRNDASAHLLVAGGKPSLFDESIRNLPRVTFWHSTEHSARQSSMAVPDRVGAIVMNRFLDHTLSKNLRNEAKRLNIPMHNAPLGPQAIVALIRDAGLMDDDAQQGPVISDTPATMARGHLRAFIKQEGRFNVASGPEIGRLFDLAQARGLPTSLASLSTTYYQVRKDYLPQDESEPTIEPAPAVAPIEAAPVELPTTPTIAPPFEPVHAAEEAAVMVAAGIVPSPFASTPQGAPMVDTKGVVSLIEDAIAALTLVKEAVASVAPTLAEAQSLRAKIDKMRAFLND